MIHVDNNDGKIRVKVKGWAIDIMEEAATLLTSIVGNALAKGAGESGRKKKDQAKEDEDEDPVWDADTTLADEVKRMMKDKGVMF